MAKIETLVDDFSVQQPWWYAWAPGFATWMDGRLRVEATTAYPGANVTARYDLTDSAVFIEVEPAPAMATRQSLVTLRASAGNELIIGVDGDPPTLLCRITTGGAFDTTNVPYDPVAMRYLRLRHAGSVVYWETAPAGSGPWTTRRQATQPSWSLTSIEFILTAGNWGSLPGGVYAWFDNLNYVVTPPPPTGRIETFTAGRQWGRAYAQGRAIESLWKAGVQVYEPPPLPPLTNLLSNGSFETDTAGWTGSLTLSRQPLSVPHGEFGSWRGQNSGTVNGAHWLQRSAALPVVSGRRYYLRARVGHATPLYGNVVQFMNTTTALTGVPMLTLDPVNAWLLYDVIWTSNLSALTLRVNYTGGSGNQMRTGWLDNVMILDLTDTFGAGSEPDIADVRDMVADGGGYWEGTQAS